MDRSGVVAGAVVQFTPELLRERHPEGKPNKKGAPKSAVETVPGSRIKP
jgi:hypothetical protein